MRLTRIATRTGDDGRTGLGDGQRVAKDDARIEALGEIDATSTAIGTILTHPVPASLDRWLDAVLTRVQSDLFAIGGELATPGHRLFEPVQVNRLDTELATANRELPPLAEFILPRGTAAAMQAHAARTLCRRAERRVIALARAVNGDALFAAPAASAAATVQVDEGLPPGLGRTAAADASVDTIRPEIAAYLNRLSDLLFVIARRLNRDAGVADVLWQREP